MFNLKMQLKIVQDSAIHRCILYIYIRSYIYDMNGLEYGYIYACTISCLNTFTYVYKSNMVEYVYVYIYTYDLLIYMNVSLK